MYIREKDVDVKYYYQNIWFLVGVIGRMKHPNICPSQKFMDFGRSIYGKTLGYKLEPKIQFRMPILYTRNWVLVWILPKV